MRCLRCKSDQRIKDGIVKGRQRYQCKACGFRYTVEYKSGITPYFKRLALMMYLEGLGFRSIGRILGVSNVAVLSSCFKLGKGFWDESWRSARSRD